MEFIYLFLLLASLYGLMILVQKWLSVPYTQIPFVTITSLLSVLYVAGLFGILWHVSHLVCLTGLGCLALHLYNAPRTFCRRLADRDSLLPLAAFGVLYFLSYFIWKDITFSVWDEFWWGIFTKIITTHDSLIAGYNEITNKDYPRISAILHYYVILFLRRGDFDEGTAIFAQTIIFLSAVPVFFAKKYNPLLLVLIACCFFCLFYLFVLPICLIYNDSMLGLCWGMSVILYLINRNRDKFICTSSPPMSTTFRTIAGQTGLTGMTLFFHNTVRTLRASAWRPSHSRSTRLPASEPASISSIENNAISATGTEKP